MVGWVVGWRAWWVVWPSEVPEVLVYGGLWTSWVEWWAVVVVGGVVSGVMVVVVLPDGVVFIVIVPGVVGWGWGWWWWWSWWWWRCCGHASRIAWRFAGTWGFGVFCSPWGGMASWIAGAGSGLGLAETALEGSHVPGSVWPAVVAVCWGWMVGRFDGVMLLGCSRGGGPCMGQGGAGCGGRGVLVIGALPALLPLLWRLGVRLVVLVVFVVLSVLWWAQLWLAFGFRLWFGFGPGLGNGSRQKRTSS